MQLFCQVFDLESSTNILLYFKLSVLIYYLLFNTYVKTKKVNANIILQVSKNNVFKNKLHKDY